MGYLINLSKVSIFRYKHILENQNLLPGRKILHQNIVSNFDAIKSCNINNLSELIFALSTAQKINSFSEKSGLSKDYLTILKREINSIQPKAVLLKGFSGLEEKTFQALADAGIKTSRDYYEIFEAENNKIKQIIQCQDKAQELFCLCNLVRINGVGAVAAKSFYDAGYKSVYDIANAVAEDMLIKVSKINDVKHYYKAKLGVKDMQFCIDFAKLIDNIENLD